MRKRMRWLTVQPSQVSASSYDIPPPTSMIPDVRFADLSVKE